MRNGIAVVIFCVLSLLGSTSARAQLNILYIGNSFTMDGEIPDTVARIASADGKAWPYWTGSLARGVTLDWHINHLRGGGNWLLTNRRFDYVVIQEFSNKPTRAGDAWDYRKDAVELVRMVRRNSTWSTPVLFQTWAYHPNNRELYPNRIPNAWEMAGDLRKEINLARSDIGNQLGVWNTRIAPVGDVFQSTGFSWDIYGNWDWKHANRKGATIAAMTIYATIYQDNLSDIPYDRVRSWAQGRGISWQMWNDCCFVVDRQFGWR
jgi:hypothetical protein